MTSADTSLLDLIVSLTWASRQDLLTSFENFIKLLKSLRLYLRSTYGPIVGFRWRSSYVYAPPNVRTFSQALLRHGFLRYFVVQVFF
jgi:hypothetical protein